MLDNFKGQIITEPFEDEIITDAEIAQHIGINTIEEVKELRASFIQSFVSNDGFKILL